jgi:rhamnosyltransferase
MATLPAVFEALRAQRDAPSFEVVAVDSGSVDGSHELLHERADRLYAIGPDEFDHGATRNFGIAHCRGSLVVMLVQDAVPAAEGWLAALVAPLLSDPGLAATYARQLPRSDASALTRFLLERWAAASPTPREQALAGADELAALSPPERHLRCVFDDVCSCLRRTTWEAIPFRRTPIAEDLEWAREVLLAGWRIRYTPEAVVVHSHERGARHELARTRAVHARLVVLFGLRTIPNRRALLRAWASSLRAHGHLAARGERLRALRLAIALPLGQYLGCRDATRSTPTPTKAA